MSSNVLIDPVLLDFSKACRLCLQQSPNELVPLFPETDFAGVSLPSKIMAYISIEISPESNVMPRNVCSKCVMQLDNWIKFKEMCESTNTLILQCLANLQPSNDESETLKFNLHGPDNTLLSDVDVSMFEDSLFNQFEDGSLQLPEDLNVSFSESLLSQKVQLSKKLPECDKSSKLVKQIQLDVPSNEGSKDVENVSLRIDEQFKVPSKWKDRYDKIYKKEYSCDLCHKTFTKFTNLLRHDRTEHVDHLNDFSCSICGALFVSQSRLDIHVLKHREKTFECPHCHKMMISKKSLSVHVRLHNADNKFVCNICNSVKGSKRMIDDHIRSVHLLETPFRCELCGKLFKTKQNREKHQNWHLHQKLYKCNICGSLQENSNSYKSHLMTHTIEKNIVCDVCGKFFKSQLLLNSHMQTHSTNKPFKCLGCPLSFSKRYLLARHESTHLDLNPFSCTYCDKTFKRKDYLTAHIRIHTCEKRYSCSVCLTAYVTLRSLKRHKCLNQEKTSDKGSKENISNVFVTDLNT